MRRRRKRRPGLKTIERKYPHQVEVQVQLGDLSNRLSAMHEWHHMRQILAVRGRSRREDGREFIRWRFVDPETALDFAEAFDGVVGLSRI